MPRKPKAPKGKKQVTALKHDEATRKNLATAELASVAERLEEMDPVAPVHYSRAWPLPKGAVRDRDPDLDPQIVWNGARIRLSLEQVRLLENKGEVEIGDAQLVWRGKDRQDWSDLVVQAPQLYIQEKVHPKAIIDDLIRRSKQAAAEKDDAPDLFADFNGLDDPKARLEFYQHDQNWSNRMILGDSLYVMASLAQREHLRGQVQCIYIDPPYGIKFNSNWQVSTRNPKVVDGKQAEITREPEQVKAFRDTWKDGIHSYLTYLRDRLIIACDLLTESGSIFVQIGDENVHRVRALMDEVFGADNAVAQIAFRKTTAQSSDYLSGVLDYLLFYAKDITRLKFRQLYRMKELGGAGTGEYNYIELGLGLSRRLQEEEAHNYAIARSRGRVYSSDNLTSQRPPGSFPVDYQGKAYLPGAGFWKTGKLQFPRLLRAMRVLPTGSTLKYKRFLEDFPVMPIANVWEDTSSGASSADPKRYVVQTTSRVLQRCILMSTDPGDLVLDPTCGSGTTAYVAEQWGRRWITIDTSRVALALARARIMGAKYPYYYLADSFEGRAKEQKVSGKIQPDVPTHGDIRQGFVYERAPHITLKSIANNAEIDVIWETFQSKLEPLRAELNATVGKSWQEWEIPHEPSASWSDNAKNLHRACWELRIARQQEIDNSIAKNAEVELLYDRPSEDKSRVRVAGPFTVESLSPHRVVPAYEEEQADNLDAAKGKRRPSKLVTPPTDFAEIVLAIC